MDNNEQFEKYVRMIASMSIDYLGGSANPISKEVYLNNLKIAGKNMEELLPAKPYTADDVRKLREKTNCGLIDCKRAMERAKGDMDRAVEILRRLGSTTWW